MSEPARSEVLLTDFPGLVNSADLRDLPPGTGADQVNLVSRIQGELSVRRGLRAVTFEGLTILVGANGTVAGTPGTPLN